MNILQLAGEVKQHVSMFGIFNLKEKTYEFKRRQKFVKLNQDEVNSDLQKSVDNLKNQLKVKDQTIAGMNEQLSWLAVQVNQLAQKDKRD